MKKQIVLLSPAVGYSHRTGKEYKTPHRWVLGQTQGQITLGVQQQLATGEWVYVFGEGWYFYMLLQTTLQHYDYASVYGDWHVRGLLSAIDETTSIILDSMGKPKKRFRIARPPMSKSRVSLVTLWSSTAINAGIYARNGETEKLLEANARLEWIERVIRREKVV